LERSLLLQSAGSSLFDAVEYVPRHGSVAKLTDLTHHQFRSKTADIHAQLQYTAQPPRYKRRVGLAIGFQNSGGGGSRLVQQAGEAAVDFSSPRSACCRMWTAFSNLKNLHQERDTGHDAIGEEAG